MSRRRRAWWRWLALGLALGALVAWQGITLMRVSGSSMAPNYRDGTVVLVIRPALDSLINRGRGIDVGDVVAAAVPGGGLSLKRVAAVGLATVEMADGRLLVDDESVPVPVSGQEGVSTVPPTVVPDGHVFLLGDDRRPLASRDSRDFGPLPTSGLRGRVIWAFGGGG